MIGADSAWRSVFEADPRRSVLARSNLDHWPPVVACSLLLEPERDQHRRLLENAVVFCSAGMPQTVVIPSLDSPWRGTLVRKLRLRRVNAVELPASSVLHFGVSPLRVVADVILPRDASVPDGRDEWLSSGGRLTTVDPGTGELNVCYTAPDLQWVVRRWSAWVQKGGGDDRSTSVLAMRAFLRMLSEAERGLGKKDLRRFGLRPVADHRDEARRLLSLRLKGGSNLEVTVTPTAAVLEIDDAVGGALESDQREQVRDWLVAASARVGIEDRLEIAHVIRDGDLLAESVEQIPRPLSAGTLARLRTASISCAWPLDVTFGAADHAAILAEIDSSLLAAAEYLSSFAGFRVCATEHGWDLDALLMPGEDLLIDVAISTLTKHGVLGDDESQREVTGEEGCAEALALGRFLALDSVPTSELVKAESAPPPPFVDAVLLEGLKLREANAAVRGENVKLNQAGERLQRTRTRARNLLGVEIAAIAIAAAVLVGLEIGAENGALNVFLGDAAVPFVVLVAVLTLLGYGLALLDLCAGWLVGMGRIAKDGVEGVMGAAVGALERATKRGAEGNGERSRDERSS